MSNSKLYSNEATKKLHEFVEDFIEKNGNDVQALDAFLSALEDECQSVNAVVDALDSESDDAYEEEWELHRHE